MIKLELCILYKVVLVAVVCVSLVVQWSAVSLTAHKVTGWIVTLCAVCMFCLREFFSSETCKLE